MTAWNDFNDADSQQSGFDLIPKGTVVPVRMTIKPGGYDDPEQGWGGGYATESFETGSQADPHRRGTPVRFVGIQRAGAGRLTFALGVL